MPATGDVDVTISRIAFPAATASDNTQLQVVWKGLGVQGQTGLAHVRAEGGASGSRAAVFDQSWVLPGIPLAFEKAAGEISLSVWRYSGGADSEPQNVGLVALEVADLGATPRQSLDMELDIDGDKATMEFRVALQGAPSPGPADEGAAAAGVPHPPAPSLGKRPGHAPVKRPVEAAPAAAAPAAAEEEPATASPASATRQRKSGEASPGGWGRRGQDVELAQLRQWIGDMLAFSVPQSCPDLDIPEEVGTECITDGANAQLSAQGGAVELSLAQIVDEPVIKAAAKEADSVVLPVDTVTGQLTAAALDVHLQCSDSSSKVIKLLRDEASSRLLECLRLPERMSRRAFRDHVQATLHIVHLIQYHGMMKADPELQVTRNARQASVHSLVAYVTADTYAEWADTRLLQHVAFEVPLVSLREVPPAADGGMSIPHLRRMIKDDQQVGAMPAAVVGRIGSGGAAAGDDLAALVDVCGESDLWLHVDGPAVFLVGSDWPQYEPLRECISANKINTSLIVCEDEVPGLGKLQGFWTFTSGAKCGGRQLPQDVSSDVDSVSARTFLPGYLHMRAVGADALRKQLDARLADAEAVRATIRNVNRRSGVAGASIVAKLHTLPSNLWTFRFTLLPSDHPMLASEYDPDQPDALQHPIPVSRINDLNSAVHYKVRAACGGRSAFKVKAVDGLAVWTYCLGWKGVSSQELSALREMVLGAGDDMVTVSPAVAEIPPILADIDRLNVMRRADFEGLELCVMRLVPPFYEGQGRLLPKDVQDIDAINQSFCERLSELADGCVARFQPVKLPKFFAVSCELRSAAVPTTAQAVALRQVVSDAVADVMKTDSTVLRIEDEMTQRGIAVAEKELEENAAKIDEMRQQGMHGALRGVPVVGDVVNWFMPVPECDEGLRFDLTTSTLKKEERTWQDAPAAAAPDSSRRE
eukprot:TRINITY_DN2357_c6_g1_i1.p1 TRINITY_DN2357_c6_g1~~TRINITY_DN2357_c6_g1_i1.p1  ORF type:complete len:931 (+),score=334.01 TRINITY_DN2357_c6_g1_i1:155-2947(+)